MAEIKSDAVQVAASVEEVRNFLEDLNHFESLMTSDRITDWQSTTDTCSFTVQGLTGIGMKREKSGLESGVEVVSHGKNPFDFTLNFNLTATSDNSCEAQAVFDGNMNFMIQTMASTPLKNLFNMMVNGLSAQFA